MRDVGAVALPDMLTRLAAVDRRLPLVPLVIAGKVLLSNMSFELLFQDDASS